MVLMFLEHLQTVHVLVITDGPYDMVKISLRNISLGIFYVLERAKHVQ